MIGSSEWQRSEFCSANGSCVEVADRPGGVVAMRDSKDPGGPLLTFTEAEWAAFVAGTKADEAVRQ